MSNYCKNCYDLTEELENHKRWLNDYKQKLQDAEEFANAKITQCANLIKQLNETHEQLEAYKMEAEEGKEINAELKAENENLKHILQTEFITVRATGKEPVLLYKGYELDKLINYKQAIEKIKEIAEKNHKTEEELFKIRHSRLPKVSMGVLNGKHNLASEILQICDEVNDDRM